MSRIYVASSWRNKYQQGVVDALRAAGHQVYDFRNPRPGETGFGWHEIDPNWQNWSAEEYRRALAHRIAAHGFVRDYDAMLWANAFCLVLPCGRSAHLEAGWACGAGKPTSIYIPEGERIEPELMYLLAGIPCTSLDEVLHFHRGAVAA